MIIKGKKVILRAIEESDLEMLRDMINDPEIAKVTVGRSNPVSSYDQKKWFETSGRSTDNLIRLIIETEKDGAVGMVSLGDFDWVNRVAHRSGIKIMASRITDSGIALDAMTTLLKYAFDELNLNRVEGKVLDSNEQSIALQKLIGFEFEGVQRQAVYKGGQYHDLYLLSMLNEDFQKGARKVRMQELKARKKEDNGFIK